jgi:hypothetical protein
MTNEAKPARRFPHLRVGVLEPGTSSTADIVCRIGSNIKFSTDKLESYCLSEWEPIIFDALLVAGAVEYCDRVQKRPAQSWGRHFEMTIAVHDPNRWNDTALVVPLTDSLGFLTGDRWEIRFVGRRSAVVPPRQGHFSIPGDYRSDPLLGRVGFSCSSRADGPTVRGSTDPGAPWHEAIRAPSGKSQTAIYLSSLPGQVRPTEVRGGQRPVQGFQVCDG